MPCARCVSDSTTFLGKTVLVGDRVGKLRRCVCEHHLRNFEYQRHFLDPPLLTLRFICLFCMLIDEHSYLSRPRAPSPFVWNIWCDLADAPPWPRPKEWSRLSRVLHRVLSRHRKLRIFPNFQSCRALQLLFKVSLSMFEISSLVLKK